MQRLTSTWPPGNLMTPVAGSGRRLSPSNVICTASLEWVTLARAIAYTPAWVVGVGSVAGGSGSRASNAANFNASSAASGSSPFIQREMRGCGMPVSFAMATCERPRARSLAKMTAVEVLMSPSYAMSHSSVYALPHYFPLHSCRMEPHKLIAALCRASGLSQPELAVAMKGTGPSGKNFQGTLNKFINGNVPQPQRHTAEAIAAYFDIPVDAIYSAEVASRVAAERGLTEGVIATMKEKTKGLSASTQARIKTLSGDELARLEAIIAGFLGPESKRDLGHITPARLYLLPKRRALNQIKTDQVNIHTATVVGLAQHWGCEWGLF